MDAHRLQRHIVKMHQPKPKQIVCPHCHVLLQPENIKRHMKHAHGKLDVQSKSGKSSTKTRSAMPAKSGKTSQPLTACPVCGVAVGERRLAKHLRKVHPTHASQAHEAKVVKQKTPQQNEQSQRQSTTRQQQLAEFEQAFHESRFGDKYVGLSRREGNGRFGSLPLYDDYSDDADTD
ncbi:MAG: hypothetical protein DYG89_39100 [Caldilinea sp. CFX5]|nr:hypothetical protein [Caldilinea sp. CFX5]